MSKIKVSLAILALLVVAGIAKAENPCEEGVSTWFHNKSTGNAIALPLNEGGIICGVAFSTWSNVAADVFTIQFLSTNTLTGSPKSSVRLWEVGVDTWTHADNIPWPGIPPYPIRGGKGFAYDVQGAANLTFTILYKKYK